MSKLSDKELSFQKTKQGYSYNGLMFGNIFSVNINNDKVIFSEECDGYYEEIRTKEEAIAILEDFIGFIKTGGSNE